MLLVRELQLHNWIMYNGKPCRVKGIDAYGEFIRTDSSNIFRLSTGYTPIPLTEKLLVKNGFAPCHIARRRIAYTYQKDDTKVEVLLNDRYYHSNLLKAHTPRKTGDTIKFDTTYNYEIEYLHQLQNALRLLHIYIEFIP